MVPYVRLSFYKHYNEIRELIPFATRKEIENVRNVSITDQRYKEKFNLIDKISYEYALKTTIKELEQAVEGLFHNLNTLQSRSGK